MRLYEVDAINKSINLFFDYDEDIIKQIKNCDYNARWNPELKTWIIPVNSYSKARIIQLIKANNFQQKVKAEIKEVEYDYQRTEVDYAYLKGLCDSKDFAYTPRRYQLEALAFALEKKCLINGDDVGLGKTFESILYAEVTNSFPCLVIEPGSVKYNWAEKWAEITKNKRSISVIESNKQNDWSADIIIINYDIIAKKQGTGATVNFSELADIDWKMVIFDEAHFLKEKKSQRAKAAAKIVKKIDRIQLLTGTAIMNKPIELWNLLVLIGKEKLIANDWKQFVMRYCGGYKGKFGWVTSGATNIFELNKKLRETCYIRREKRDVMDELPEITKQVIKVPISNKKAYQAATNDLIEFVRQTKGDDKAEKAMEAEHLVMMNVLRTLAIEGKMKAIKQYLKDWKEADKGKLLIFALHTAPLEELSAHFKSPLIAGGVAPKKKQKIVREFIESDDIFLFANMQSAGTGVDGLQEVCSNELILELPWRPSDLAQAIGRIERSGQKSSMTATFMLNDETIDWDMYLMLQEKEAITEAINKGKDILKSDSGLKAVLKRIVNSNRN